MPNVTAPALTFPTKALPGQLVGSPSGIVGELSLSEIAGRYSTLVKAGKCFYTSQVAVTSPVAFTSASATGPVLWNKPGSGIDAHILAISVTDPSTASGVAGSLGWVSNVQPTAPSGSPASLATFNCYAGGGTSQLGGVFSAATVIILPTPIFMPLLAVSTAAVTLCALSTNFIDVAGGLIVGPGNFGSVVGSATLTSLVVTIGIVWAELPA